ncbi:MAG: hypothetical protein WBQ68_02255, partial [Terriglobales bacterium]
MSSEALWILAIGSAMGQEQLNLVNGSGMALGLIGVATLTGLDFSSRNSLAVGSIAVLLGAAAWAVGVCLSPKLKLPANPMGRAAIP